MFTGIIEEMGCVSSFGQNNSGVRLTVQAKVVVDDLKTGDSVTVNGACVTALEISPAGFSCDLSPETLSITNLAELKIGDRVNLERAMRMDDRLGGHMVSGHVEGTGKIEKKSFHENAIILSIAVPSEILKYCVHKGSITLDGVSMTVNAVSETSVEVSVIPHTAEMTTLGFKGVDDSVNIESDLVCRYVARLLQGGAISPYV